MEVILEIIKYLGVVTTAIFAYHSTVRGAKLKKRNEVVTELKTNIYDIKMMQIKEVYDLQRMSILEQNIKKVLYETPINRFTILFVMNGKTVFDFLTVLFDQKLGDTHVGAVSPYTKIRIDDRYRKMITRIEYEGGTWINMNDGFGRIGEYFLIEGIEHSFFSFVKRVQLDTHNDMVVFTTASIEFGKDFNETQKKVIELLIYSKIVPKIKEIISIDFAENGKIK